MNAYIGAAVERYCRLVARTLVILREDVDPEIREDRDDRGDRADRDEGDRPAVQAIRRARSIRPAPIAMPTIGTEAIPTENATDTSRNSSRAPMP